MNRTVRAFCMGVILGLVPAWIMIGILQMKPKPSVKQELICMADTDRLIPSAAAYILNSDEGVRVDSKSERQHEGRTMLFCSDSAIWFARSDGHCYIEDKPQ